MAAILLHGFALLLAVIPSGDVWQRTELASHICIIISFILLLRIPGIVMFPRSVLAVWIGFGGAVAFSALFTSESAFEFIQVIRRVWLIPTIWCLVSYKIYTQSKITWWLVFTGFAAVAYVLMLLSVVSTPVGVYVPSVNGWTGSTYRLYLHYLDNTIALNGPTTLAYAFPMGALTLLLLIGGSRVGLAAGALGLFSYSCLALLTGTRTGMLATIGASFLTLTIYLIRSRRIFALIAMAISGVAFALGLFILIRLSVISPEMAERFTFAGVGDSTLTGRTPVWQERWQYISDNFTGVGYLNATSYGYQSLSSHNAYLEAFYSLGWPAGLAYSGFVLTMLAWSISLTATRAWKACLPMLWLSLMFAAYGLVEAIFVSSVLMHYTISVCFGACFAELTIYQNILRKRVFKNTTKIANIKTRYLAW